MPSFRKMVTFLGFSTIAVTGCKSAHKESQFTSLGNDEDPLAIVAKMHVKLAEFSGLCWRKDPDNGRLDIFAVGDRSFDVVKIKATPQDLQNWPLQHESIDLKNLISPLTDNPHKGSQWEAVASDGNGFLFILNESQSQVFVVDPATKKLMRTIILKVRTRDDISEDWEDDKDSRGEGMVLLKNGHILLLKEKKPSLIIEFGPEEDEAEGYTPGDAVTVQDKFPLPAASLAKFVVLNFWTASTNAAAHAKDLSEITVGPEGRLYALSDKSSAIFSMERKLMPTEAHFGFKNAWYLDPRVEKAEGLIFASNKKPLVASDVEGNKLNLFYLTALSEE